MLSGRAAEWAPHYTCWPMTFVQAVLIGMIQGVAELFPISSLGQTILVPALIGGSWQRLVVQQASPESPYLAFIVGLHVATAAALIAFFWRDWLRVISSFFVSIARRRVETADERLAWLIVIATIPVGLLGLLLEHQFRTLFAKPLAAATFLTVNGLILLSGEWLRRNSLRRRDRQVAAGAESPPAAGEAGMRRADTLTILDAVGIGFAQSSALLAGISRDGVCMVAGLARGLSREEAARFSFMLSAPPIFAAGLLKIPDLLGPLGAGIRPQILAGSVAAFLMALLSVRFLLRYFQSGSLVPFAAFSLVFGVACIVRFGLF
jgi:undecaprenyl-diphosphatase